MFDSIDYDRVLSGLALNRNRKQIKLAPRLFERRSIGDRSR